MADTLISGLPTAGALDLTDRFELERGTPPASTSHHTSLQDIKNAIVTPQWTQMTQAAYDALPEKDPNVLYVIVG